MASTRIVKGVAQRDWHPNSPYYPNKALEDLSKNLNSGPNQLQENERIVHVDYTEYSDSCVYTALIEKHENNIEKMLEIGLQTLENML